MPPETREELLSRKRDLYRRSLQRKVKSTKEDTKQNGERVGGILGFGSVARRDYTKGERNLLGNIFERPGAAVRGAIRGMAPGGETPLQGFTRGSLRPGSIGTFQEQMLRGGTKDIVERAANRQGILAANTSLGQAAVMGESLLRGSVLSPLGMAADVLTNPASLLLMISGKIPTGKGTTLGGKISGSRVGQTFRRIGNTKIGKPKSVQTVQDLRNPVKMANDIREVAFDFKRKAGATFDDAVEKISIKSPTRRADVTRAVSNFKKDLDAPGIQTKYKSAIRRSGKRAGRLTKGGKTKGRIPTGETPRQVGTLERAINDPDFASNLTTRQMIDIKQDIKLIPGMKAKFKQMSLGKDVQWEVSDIPFLDLYDDVTQAQLSAFPEMEVANNAYKSAMDTYNFVSNSFKKGSLVNNIKSNFKNEPETLDAIRTIFDPKTLKRIGGFQGAIRTLDAMGVLSKFVGKAALWAAGGAAAGAGLGAVVKRSGGKE